MSAGNPKEQHSDRGGGGGPRNWLWVTVVWARVVVGLGLAAIGGVAFGHAWTNDRGPMWWVSGITLLSGILLLLSGLYARSHPPGVKADVVFRDEPPEQQEAVVPLLGALLVYKYHLITQEQLNEALEEQRGSSRRIGEILLEKGLITESELKRALEYQRSYTPEKNDVHRW